MLAKRCFHPRMNPYQWANREITYRPEDYERTLDILARTCRVSLGAQYPLPVMQWQKRILRSAATKGISPVPAPAIPA